MSAGNNAADDANALHACWVTPLCTTNQQCACIAVHVGHAAPMTRDIVNAICETLPGAELSDPWGGGHDAWKVGGKMFASIGVQGIGVAVKCATIDDALHLEDMFGWPKAPYFHRSWVLIPMETAQDELRHRITTSYKIVRGSLTKKAQAALPAMND